MCISHTWHIKFSSIVSFVIALLIVSSLLSCLARKAFLSIFYDWAFVYNLYTVLAEDDDDDDDDNDSTGKKYTSELHVILCSNAAFTPHTYIKYPSVSCNGKR